MPSKKVIFILGPTSSGKTSLSLDVAERFNGEIINIDSQQLIRDLDIATAKIQPIEMRGIQHHLIDTYELKDDINVFDFALKAEKIIDNIVRKKKIPVVVGGTGLYARVLSGGVGISRQTNVDAKLRNKLEQQSLSKLVEQVRKLNGWGSLNDSDRGNRRRLIRLIEKEMSTNVEGKVFLGDFQKLKIAILPPLNLDQLIRKNVTNMIRKGLIDETKMLLKKYPDFENKVKAIGYKETLAYLRREILTENELIDLISVHTRQYAKRQITWLKKEPDIIWVEDSKSAIERIKTFLK